MSSYTDDLNTSRLLLERGAESGLKNVKGQTALHLAIKKNATEQVRLLLNHNPPSKKISRIFAKKSFFGSFRPPKSLTRMLNVAFNKSTVNIRLFRSIICIFSRKYLR